MGSFFCIIARYESGVRKARGIDRVMRMMFCPDASAQVYIMTSPSQTFIASDQSLRR